MPNTIIKNKILGSIQQIFHDYHLTTETMEHSGLKGNFREYGIGKVLEMYLPRPYSIGKGVIVDNKDNQSAEIDLLIYDSSDMSPILFSEIEGVFPLESCKYVFEIKSKSTATEIQTTIQKFQKLKSLHSLNGSGPITVYYAYSSDLSELNEFERYIKYDTNFKNNPAIDIICVAGNGYWYRRDSWYQKEKLNFCYQYLLSDENHIETLTLLSGLLNTLNPRTPIGYYLLNEGFFKFAYFYFVKLNIEIGVDSIIYFNEYRNNYKQCNYELEVKNIIEAAGNKTNAIALLSAFAEDENERDIARKNYYLQKVNGMRQ